MIDTIPINYESYLSHEKRYSNNTVKAYMNDLQSFKKYLIESCEVDNVLNAKSLHARSWIVELSNKKVKAVSINRCISSVRNFYKFTIKRGALKALIS